MTVTDPTYCPTCGSLVEAVSDDEGTGYYRPILEAAEANALVDEALAALEAWKRGQA